MYILKIVMLWLENVVLWVRLMLTNERLRWLKAEHRRLTRELEEREPWRRSLGPD
jgi:hypothetical protein